MRRPVESLAVSITFTAWRRRMVTITAWRMGAIVPLQRAPPAAVRRVFVVRRAARTAAVGACRRATVMWGGARGRVAWRRR